MPRPRDRAQAGAISIPSLAKFDEAGLSLSASACWHSRCTVAPKYHPRNFICLNVREFVSSSGTNRTTGKELFTGSRRFKVFLSSRISRKHSLPRTWRRNLAPRDIDGRIPRSLGGIKKMRGVKEIGNQRGFPFGKARLDSVFVRKAALSRGYRK